MNSPAPGWLPDPTGRHEHRYWDGFNWTSDVSDGGVTSFDPYEAAAPQQPLGYGQQGYSSGPYGAIPAAGGGSGPSTGLLVGLGAAILVVILAIVFVVASGGDDDDGDPIATTDENSLEDDSTDTTGDDTTDTTEDAGDDSGDDGTLDESDQIIIDGMAEGIMASSNGALTEEDAACIAEEMYTEIGFERLAEMTADADASDPLGGFSSDELAEVMDVMLTCVDAETLVDMGYENSGG